MTRLERVAASAAALALVVLVLTDAVPLLRGPAPYPPEWQWLLRIERPAASRYAWPAGSAAALIGLLAASGGRWFRERPRRGAAILLAGATVLGTSFQLGLLGMEPQGAFRTLRSRVMSRTDTAYLTVAASDQARDPLAFLDRHAALLLDFRKTAKHAATHPPGPVLYYRAWIAVTAAAALWGGLFVLVLGAAACGPIALLLRTLGLDALAAARVGALWPLVPGAALMSPQFDQALALPVVGACALLAAALAATTPRTRLLAATGAGTLAFAAVFFSYGAAAFVAIGGVAVLAALGWRRAMTPVAVATVAALAWLGLTAALGHEPMDAARTALAFHREMYTAPRSYALWLAFNPIDFALFLGAPVAVIARPAPGPCARRSVLALPGRVPGGARRSSSSRGPCGARWAGSACR